MNVSSIRYGNKAFTDKIKQSLAKIAFDGASGHINFDSRSGYVNRIVDILHTLLKIGCYSNTFWGAPANV